ncbi:PhzF family phenazine biosynthesis isomerase [Streptomyces chartreusis]|uniref:PhzF family phenazine biosynthesis protein n=1 Tax=Streptomyces chartreusis TaxID=1969 RepID=UPI002E193743|nr:PhzF family phenazine biosynthesis isomerase [Streptomyces chartreusis]
MDVFTNVALQGNPLAVFLDASGLSSQQMQSIAREMNLSETTFVLPARNGGDAHVRIFTPVNELAFAGHPMLGTAVALGESTTRKQLLLETAMGTIPLTFQRTQGRPLTASMRQPIPSWEPYNATDELLAALGVASSILPVDAYRNGPRHIFIGLKDTAALSRVRPDLNALAQHKDMAANCFAGSGEQWRMRMFSPAYGVAEDAATGSAAGPLAVHLSRYGLIRFGQQIEITQGVEMGRPAHMYASSNGSCQQVDAVDVAGSAVVIARGTLLI